MRQILAVAVLALAVHPATALYIPTPTRCLCYTGGLAMVIKEKHGKSCDLVCRATVKSAASSKRR